jgi:hypothetical protein
MSLLYQTGAVPPAAGRCSEERNLRAICGRATHRAAAAAKRAYPVVLGFALFGAVIAAAIAVRTLVWLTAFRH